MFPINIHLKTKFPFLNNLNENIWACLFYGLKHLEFIFNFQVNFIERATIKKLKPLFLHSAVYKEWLCCTKF